MSTAKLKMRGADLTIMEDRKRLPDISKQTYKVFECFKKLNANEFKELVVQLLA
jgi:hypothetical protein